MNSIRVWQQLDCEEIDTHLIVVDDLHGYCPGCKQTGIAYGSMSKCPGCGREFRFAATRVAADSDAGRKILDKVMRLHPELVVVDYQDLLRVTQAAKARNLFK